jgi:hypothetical protein
VPKCDLPHADFFKKGTVFWIFLTVNKADDEITIKTSIWYEEAEDLSRPYHGGRVCTQRKRRAPM